MTRCQSLSFDRLAKLSARDVNASSVVMGNVFHRAHQRHLIGDRERLIERLFIEMREVELAQK